MSRIDLRDISTRLTNCQDADEVVSELLGYLQAVRSGWRASLAMYDLAQDALVKLYRRERRRPLQDAIRIPADRLPARLVRKFLHPSAFFGRASNRTLLANLIQSSPVYEAVPADLAGLEPIAPIPNWQSCVCMPLNDREDVLGLLTIASAQKGAFPSSAIGDIIPILSMTSLALVHHLQASGDQIVTSSRAEERRIRETSAEFQTQIQRMHQYATDLEVENKAKQEKLELLSAQIKELEKGSRVHREELDDMKRALHAIEDQSGEATEKLTEAYTQMGDVQLKLGESQRTVRFIREVFQMLSQEHRQEDFASTLLTWYCENFGIERCSLMLLDGNAESLRIAAFHGIEPSVARDVRVQLGQGVAGWVAHHRKPLFIRGGEDEAMLQTNQRDYNSDSFISIPLVFNGRLFGVLNLSNKTDGETFDEIDMDRAMLTGSVLGLAIGSREAAQRMVA